LITLSGVGFLDIRNLGDGFVCFGTSIFIVNVFLNHLSRVSSSLWPNKVKPHARLWRCFYVTLSL
jgi:hypothetical protein